MSLVGILRKIFFPKYSYHLAFVGICKTDQGTESVESSMQLVRRHKINSIEEILSCELYLAKYFNLSQVKLQNFIRIKTPDYIYDMPDKEVFTNNANR